MQAIYVPGYGQLAPGTAVISAKGVGWKTNIGDPGKSNGKGGNTNVTSATFVVPFIPTCDCFAPRFLFDNACRDAATYSDAALTNDLPIDNAYFWDGASAATRITFGGANGFTIPAGRVSYALSDERSDLILRKGTKYYVRLHVALASAGQSWPFSHNAYAGALDGDGFVYNGDSSASGAYTSAGGYDPYYFTAAFGRPILDNPLPTVGWVGDSILAGTNDAGTTTLPGSLPAPYGGATRVTGLGWPMASLGAQSNTTNPYPVHRMAYPGAKVAQLATLSSFPGMPVEFAWCDYVVCQGGINDIMLTAATLSQIQGFYQTLWSSMRSAGARAVQAKILPGNAMTTPQQANRVALNSWFDTQVGTYLYATIDPSPAVETAPGSNTWIGGLTSDSLHPNGAGVNAIAALLYPTLTSLLAPRTSTGGGPRIG